MSERLRNRHEMILESAAPQVNLKEQSLPADWRMTGLVLFVANLCVIGLFWPTVRGMVEMWESSRTFSHGFLVLPATGYLIWSHRETLSRMVPSPSAWGLVAVIGAEIGWGAGSLKNVEWLQQAAVIALVPSLAWTFLGTEIVQILLWPLGFLVFMLPVGTYIEPWLQDFTAWLVLVGLKMTGIPYLYKDYLITVPSGAWEVAADCGGLRYLLPGLALGYAFSTLNYRQPVRRLVFLLVCAGTLMLANGVRAYGVIAGDYLGIAEGTDHRVFSYTVYGITIPLLFWLGLKWKERTTVDSSCPERTVNAGCGYDGRKTILIATAALALLAIAPLSGWLWGVRS